jgi:Tfp pilus assembly protein PilF
LVALILTALAPLVPRTQAARNGSNGVLMTPEEWNTAVASVGLDPARIANPLAYTAEIAEKTRQVTQGANTLEKLERLQEYLFDPESAFSYDFVGTLTAQEAYERREGNCVAFTNLFIAMARSVGLPVEAALVSPKGKPEAEGDLSLVKNHVVALYRHAEGATVYDFFRSRTGAPIRIRPVDDLWSAAIYINNLGVAALRDDRLDEASDRFETALRLAPAYAALYGNVGVVKRRQGDLSGAVDAYLLALLIEPRNGSIRGNLQQALVALADRARQEAEADGGDEYKRLMAQAAAQLRDGDPRAAGKTYTRASRAVSGSAAPLVALARCQLLRGRPALARKKLVAALQIDPDEAEARRLLDAVERTFLASEIAGDDGEEEVQPEPSWSR